MYQAAAKAGKDDEFGKDADHLVAYDESNGFYAVYLMRPTVEHMVVRS